MLRTMAKAQLPPRRRMGRGGENEEWGGGDKEEKHRRAEGRKWIPLLQKDGEKDNHLSFSSIRHFQCG